MNLASYDIDPMALIAEMISAGMSALSVAKAAFVMGVAQGQACVSRYAPNDAPATVDQSAEELAEKLNSIKERQAERQRRFRAARNVTAQLKLPLSIPRSRRKKERESSSVAAREAVSRDADPAQMQFRMLVPVETAIPADHRLSDDNLRAARGMGLTDTQTETSHKKFTARANADGWLKVNWHAAELEWLIREASFLGVKPTAPRSEPSSLEALDSAFAPIYRRLEAALGAAACASWFSAAAASIDRDVATVTLRTNAARERVSVQYAEQLRAAVRAEHPEVAKVTLAVARAPPAVAA